MLTGSPTAEKVNEYNRIARFTDLPLLPKPLISGGSPINLVDIRQKATRITSEVTTHRNAIKHELEQIDKDLLIVNRLLDKWFLKLRRKNLFLTDERLVRVEELIKQISGGI